MRGILIEEKDDWGGRQGMKVMNVTGKVLWGESYNVDSENRKTGIQG